MSNLLPKHGHIGCRVCFTAAGDSCEFLNLDGSKWRIEQPNAAWGSQNPEVLVLGFSRGGNQSKPGIPFDEIAFKGMRPQLAKILKALNLLKNEEIDSKIHSAEKHFAFGSLIRCSVSQWDEKTRAYSKSGGAILQKFAKGNASRRIAENCSSQFLGNIPPSTKLVVLLGNQTKYIQFCHELAQKARGEAKWVNSMAYDSKGVRFVHVIHAKAQGRLIPDWLSSTGSQVQKRRESNEAVSALKLEPA